MSWRKSPRRLTSLSPPCGQMFTQVRQYAESLADTAEQLDRTVGQIAEGIQAARPASPLPPPSSR